MSNQDPAIPDSDLDAQPGHDPNFVWDRARDGSMGDNSVDTDQYHDLVYQELRENRLEESSAGIEQAEPNARNETNKTNKKDEASATSDPALGQASVPKILWNGILKGLLSQVT